MTLKTLLKNKNLRFKTFNEMQAEFGLLWYENIPQISPDAAICLISAYAGKPVYPNMIKDTYEGNNTFMYGPTQSIGHACILTTRMFPKYMQDGTIIRPGMIVTCTNGNEVSPRVDYPVPNYLLNELGTTVRVLRVKTPSHLLTPQYADMLLVKGDVASLNKHTVAVELRMPKSILWLDKVQHAHSEKFINRKVNAFEFAFRLRPATEEEKRKYHLENAHGDD